MTKRPHYLREVVPAGPKAAAEAEKVLRRLANQVDERRHPRTNATVDQLLDTHFELLTLEQSTLATYVGYADRHIRPLIGTVAVRDEIDAGAVGRRQLLPSIKDIAARHDVSASTAQRAVSLLQKWRYVEVISGRGARVIATAAGAQGSSSTLR